MPEYYPAFLNIEDRPCVVIGGGAVAEQKVKLLLQSRAKVTVISPDFTPAIQEFGAKDKLTLIQRQYRHGDLHGQFIATAATDDNEVNEAVFREANERGIPVNVVDVTRLCSFIVPAVVRRGSSSCLIRAATRSQKRSSTAKCSHRLKALRQYCSTSRRCSSLSSVPFE